MLVEHVRMQGTEEEAGGGARIGDPHRSGVAGPGEVALDDPEGAAWRGAVGLAVERQPDLGGALVHVDGDDGRDRARQERNQLLGEGLEDDARILGAGERIELQQGGRQLDVAPLHRLEEEALLRLDVPQQRGGGHVQLARDVGEGRGLEALLREDPPRCGEQLGPLNGCRASHL